MRPIDIASLITEDIDIFEADSLPSAIGKIVERLENDAYGATNPQYDENQRKNALRILYQEIGYDTKRKKWTDPPPQIAQIERGGFKIRDKIARILTSRAEHLISHDSDQGNKEKELVGVIQQQLNKSISNSRLIDIGRENNRIIAKIDITEFAKNFAQGPKGLSL